MATPDVQAAAGVFKLVATVIRLLLGVPVTFTLWLWVLSSLDAPTWVWVLFFTWMPVMLVLAMAEEVVKLMSAKD